MNGKGIFIWKGSQIAMLNEDVVSKCVDLGLDWVAIKIGNGSSTGYATFTDMPGAVKRFKDQGISVWGWHYVTGGNGYDSIGPRQDAEFAISQADRLGLDGYLIDAESEYKIGDNPPARAQLYADTLQPLAAEIPVGLCSFRFPSYHPEFPWRQMLSVATLHVPQLYWGPGRMLIDLNRSFTELQALKVLPYVPVGRNYVGDGYAGPAVGQEAAWIQQFVQEINDFMTICKSRKFPGFSFWALDFCFLSTHAGGAQRYEAIKAFQWQPESLPDPYIYLNQRMDGLEQLISQHKTEIEKIWSDLQISSLSAATAINDIKAFLIDYVTKERDLANNLHPPKPTGGAL